MSWLERVVNRGPFRNASANPVSCLLNITVLSCLLPGIGFVYTKFTGIILISPPMSLQQLSSDIVIAWIALFLFTYTLLVYYASHRVKGFLRRIRDCIDLDENDFQTFEATTSAKIYKPPVILLILLFLTVPPGVYGVVSSPLFAGDTVVTFLLGMVLAYCCFLHWVAGWMLLMFLRTSSRFGLGIPLCVNVFDPDRVGGLAPLADLSTFAVFAVGMLSVIAIPMWYMFFNVSAYVILVITSILIPCYFFYSMRGVYLTLSEKKQNALKDLNDRLESISTEIFDSMKIGHQSDQLDEERLGALGHALNSINIIRQRISSMHAFPLNSEILIKVILSAVLPIMGIVIDFLIAVYL